MAEHTPGPWHTSDYGTIWSEHPLTGEAKVIGDLSDLGNSDENEANARLIAAVPDLLAAAEAALPAIRWGMAHQPGNMSQWVECEAQLQAAIAKARGQGDQS